MKPSPARAASVLSAVSSRAAAFSSLLAFAAGACATGVGGLEAVRPARGDMPYSAVEQLGRVLAKVENDYVDPVDRAKLVDGAIKGMVAELDPHSSYMTPEEFRAFQSDTEGAFGGIGIEVETQREKLVVLAPIDGSPASRAGIRSGDVIVSIDGKDPGEERLDKLVRHLRGVPGSRVKVGVRRPGVDPILAFDLVREVIRVASVSSRLLVNGVAYIHIRQFQERTHDELLAAAAKLRSRAGGRLTGILLDLRSDPGGLVDQAADVADEFLDGGIIYTTRHRGKVVDEVSSRAGGAFVREPCVVLVNQYTASAAELVAGALQDQKRATIVGERTFGKGSVQAILALSGGAGMRLTVSRYYTPSGHAIQADGVHPDISVELKKEDGAAASASLRAVREKDLDGHLAAEPAPNRPDIADAKTIWVVDGVVDGGGGQPVSRPLAASGSDAPEVPEDPDRGNDAVLKVGWQVLGHAIGAAASSR